ARFARLRRHLPSWRRFFTLLALRNAGSREGSLEGHRPLSKLARVSDSQPRAHIFVYRYKSPAKYLKPLSTATVATVLPRPSSCASCSAAVTFSPDDVPANIPSSFANRRAISRAAPSSTVRASS